MRRLRPILPSILLALLLHTAALATPWVVAHRGGAALGPENTIETFEKACLLGVDAVELDIHQSKDGKLMVIHDNALKRTHGHDGQVDQMNLRELRLAGVPTLQEVIDQVAGRCRLVVEIKHPKNGRHRGIERRLLKELETNNLLDQAIVISFDKKSLRRLHKLQPRLKTGYLYRSPPADLKEISKDLGVSYLGPHYLLANQQLLEQAHALGLKVNPWTVNDQTLMRKLIELGYDAITTDQPDRLIQELKSTQVIFFPKQEPRPFPSQTISQ